jgi:hypothetical protein
MSFFKNLFGKKDEPEAEPFVPTPTQNIPGLEPIIVQAIENLFPDVEQQAKAFKYALDYKLAYKEKTKRDDIRGLLAMLAFSKGRIENLPEPSLWFFAIFRVEELDVIFPKMRDAEEWVASITKTRV